MAWNSVAPHVKAQGAQLKLGVFQVGKGGARLTLTLGAALLKELGSPKRATVFAGDGDEAGQMLVQFDTDGEHALSELTKGGGQDFVAPDRRRADGGDEAQGRGLRTGDVGGECALPHCPAALVTG
jgi:hypothetical protein